MEVRQGGLMKQPSRGAGLSIPLPSGAGRSERVWQASLRGAVWMRLPQEDGGGGSFDVPGAFGISFGSAILFGIPSSPQYTRGLKTQFWGKTG